MVDPRETKQKQDPRKDRLKAALKANMGKRKAQARSRADTAGTTGKSAEQKSE